MTIKQFNASYFIHEDRLLFRISTAEDEEYRFWFTRRITLFILESTKHLLTKNLEKEHSTEVAQAVIQFEQEAAKVGQTNAEGKLATIPHQIAASYPIGVDPLLVMDVKCQMVQENAVDVLLLDLLLPANGSLNLKMSGTTLHAMCALLNQLADQWRWTSGILVPLEGATEQLKEKVINPLAH